MFSAALTSLTMRLSLFFTILTCGVWLPSKCNDGWTDFAHRLTPVFFLRCAGSGRDQQCAVQRLTTPLSLSTSFPHNSCPQLPFHLIILPAANKLYASFGSLSLSLFSPSPMPVAL
jgi:hypothetical protein